MDNVTIQKVEDGISKFVDAVILADMPKTDLKTVAIGVGIAIKVRTSLSSWLDTLGLVDKNGNVNIDIAKEELSKRMPEEGMIFDADRLGKTFVFDKEDIDKLYKFIVE